MWSHNSFGNNSPFPNGFTQEDFMFPSTFPNSSATKQSFAPRPHHDVLIDLCSSNGHNNSGYMPNSIQPEVGLYNQPAFDLGSQSASPIAQCNPSASQTANANANPSPRPTAPQISTRAAELKAQLLARRGSSSTSPSAAPPSNVTKVAQETPKNTILSRPSPHLPLNTEKLEQELKLNDLISQYSESKTTSSPKTKQEIACRQTGKSIITPKPPHPSKISSQVQQTTKNDLKDQKLVNINKASEIPINREPSKRSKKRKDTESDASEGEIIEETGSSKHVPAPDKKKNGQKSSSNGPKADQNMSHKSLVEQAAGKTRNRVPQEASSPCPLQKSIHGAKTECNPSQSVENMTTRQENKNNSKGFQEQDLSIDAGTQRHSHQNLCLSNRDVSENNSDHGTESSCQAKDQEHLSKFPPNIADILPHDIDLKEWLEITGYHNAPYRNKILARRRAIAALDAQREKLLAEIEAEERGGLPIAIGIPYQPSSMLPPPMASLKLRPNIESTSVILNSSPMQDTSHNTASNKRPYSSVQDSYTENGPGKIARIEEKSRSTLGKDDERSENRNAKSNGHDSTKSHASDEREDKDSSRSRLNGSGNSRDRNTSPGLQAHSRKTSIRAKRHENDPYDDDDVSETGSRPFEVRGNYRGRSFNPNYRGRGRGRGRGEAQDRSPESRAEGSHGPRTGSSKSHKTPKGSGRGDKGCSH